MPASFYKLLANQSPFAIKYFKRQLCSVLFFAIFAASPVPIAVAPAKP
jgi:hypothetical protein